MILFILQVLQERKETEERQGSERKDHEDLQVKLHLILVGGSGPTGRNDGINSKHTN